jgi:hypothetical protein
MGNHYLPILGDEQLAAKANWMYFYIEAIKS